MRSMRGFSLLEVLIAIGILAVGVTALAPLAAIAMHANAGAGTITSAALLAQDKMEQLRSLAWTLDAQGAPVSDLTTDVASWPNATGSGAGLAASPPDALEHDTAGYCDFVDSRGRLLGGGTTPPASAAYVRRWSIVPLPALPDRTLILQVRVTDLHGRTSAGAAVAATRLPGEARLVSLKTRKGP